MRSRLASVASILLSTCFLMVAPVNAQSSDELFDPSVLNDIELSMKQSDWEAFRRCVSCVEQPLCRNRHAFSADNSAAIGRVVWGDARRCRSHGGADEFLPSGFCEGRS